MTSPLILSIDQGTTSSRAVVFDANGTPVASEQQEFTQHFPRDGWVEHDATEIWRSVEHTCRKALDACDARHVSAVGITNQRETTVALGPALRGATLSGHRVAGSAHRPSLQRA